VYSSTVYLYMNLYLETVMSVCLCVPFKVNTQTSVKNKFDLEKRTWPVGLSTVRKGDLEFFGA
jgi:hypothetical protein